MRQGMIDSPSGLALAAVIGLALGPALHGCGSNCDPYRSAVCGGPITGAIESFRVRTSTGADGSDAAIFLCLELSSTSLDDCGELETGADDFETRSTDEFMVSLPVADGDLRAFYIANEGGGFLGNNEWDLIGLEVDAFLADGTTVRLYEEPEIECGGTLDDGDDYIPKDCEF